MNKILDTAIGKGFGLMTVLFASIFILGLILMLIVGLFQNNLMEMYSDFFSKIYQEVNKILGMYVLFGFIFSLMALNK